MVQQSRPKHTQRCDVLARDGSPGCELRAVYEVTARHGKAFHACQWDVNAAIKYLMQHEAEGRADDYVHEITVTNLVMAVNIE